MIDCQPANVDDYQEEIEKILLVWRPVLSFSFDINAVLVLSMVSFGSQSLQAHVFTLMVFAAPALVFGALAGWFLPWFVGVRFPIERSWNRLTAILSIILGSFLLADHYVGFRYTARLLGRLT